MQSYDPQLTAPSLPYRLFNMEVALALVIFLLLLIIIGFWVILPVGPLKEFLTTIINDAHSTYKLGIASKQQPSIHDKVATRPLYHHPLKHQYKGEHNDDTGTDDTDIDETITNSTVTTNDINLKETPDNKSSFESSSLEMMNNDKNARKISMRKNETKNCDKSPLATSSLQWPSTLSSLSSPPPSPPLSPPPSPLPILPPPPARTAKETTITSSDENTELHSKTKQKSKKKKRKRNNSTSQPQSLPTKCQKKPSVDIPYSSLSDDIKKKHPDHQKYTSDKPESAGLPDAAVKTVPIEARGAISLPQPPVLSCPLPPVITVPPSGNQSTHSMVSPPPLPIPHHGHMSLESSNSVPPPVLPSVPPVVVRDESVNGANNEEGGIVSQLDLVKFENENTRAIENERDIDDDDDDDAAVGARVPSSQLPELVTEHVPVQSSTDAPPLLLDSAWEAQQPVDVNMEPPTNEIVITPLVLHFPQELQDEAELVLPDFKPFKEPESFIDSGDDIN